MLWPQKIINKMVLIGYKCCSYWFELTWALYHRSQCAAVVMHSKHHLVFVHLKVFNMTTITICSMRLKIFLFQKNHECWMLNASFWLAIWFDSKLVRWIFRSYSCLWMTSTRSLSFSSILAWFSFFVKTNKALSIRSFDHMGEDF